MSDENKLRMIGGTPFNCDKCGKPTSQQGLCWNCRTFGEKEPPSEHVDSPRQNEPTPRTDAEASDGWSGDAECVAADFARQLEREVTQWQALAKLAQDESLRLRKELDKKEPLSDDVKAVKKEGGLGGPIPLNDRQREVIKEWAADSPLGDLWGNDEAREINLPTFARSILAAGLKEASEHSTHVLQNARKLIDQLDAIHADPRYEAVWVSYANHGRTYRGPYYVDELRALRQSVEHAEKLIPSEHDGIQGADQVNQTPSVAAPVTPKSEEDLGHEAPGASKASNLAIQNALKELIECIESYNEYHDLTRYRKLLSSPAGSSTEEEDKDSGIKDA